MSNKHSMLEVIARVNRYVKAANMFRSAGNSSYDHFFELYQARIGQSPQLKDRYIEEILSEPLTLNFIAACVKNFLKQHAGGANIGDIENEAVSTAIHYLKDTLPNYDPRLGRSLKSYIGKATDYSTMRELDNFKRQRAIGGKFFDDLDQNDFREYPNTQEVIDSKGDFIEDKREKESFTEMSQKLQRNLRLLSQLTNMPNPSAMEIEGIKALKAQIADLQHKLGLPFSQEDEDLAVSDPASAYAMGLSQKIPANDLSEHFYNLMKVPSSAQARLKLPKNGIVPTHSFFSKHIEPGEDYQKLLTKLMFESMVEIRQEYSQSKHTNQDIKTQRSLSVGNINEAVSRKMAEKMAEHDVPPQVQKRMLEYINGGSLDETNLNRNRELHYRLMDTDELSRFAMYSYMKDSIAPGKDWSQLTDEDIERIANQVYTNMDYANNQSMTVRSVDPRRGKQLDYSPRATKGLPGEQAISIIRNEINNLRSGRQGHELLGTLPSESPYFYESKLKSSPQPEPPPDMGAIYQNVGNQALQQIHASSEGLLRFAEWCDKQRMHRLADEVHAFFKGGKKQLID